MRAGQKNHQVVAVGSSVVATTPIPAEEFAAISEASTERQKKSYYIVPLLFKTFQNRREAVFEVLLMKGTRH